MTQTGADRGLPSRRSSATERLWLSSWGRHGLVTAFLLGCTVPLAWSVKRRYGTASARRFHASMWMAILCQQVLVAIALKRSVPKTRESNRHRLTLVDAITLSRGGTG